MPFHLLYTLREIEFRRDRSENSTTDSHISGNVEIAEILKCRILEIEGYLNHVCVQAKCMYIYMYVCSQTWMRGCTLFPSLCLNCVHRQTCSSQLIFKDNGVIGIYSICLLCLNLNCVHKYVHWLIFGGGDVLGGFYSICPLIFLHVNCVHRQICSSQMTFGIGGGWVVHLTFLLLHLICIHRQVHRYLWFYRLDGP